MKTPQKKRLGPKQKARLIAAAPDMLCVLREIEREIECYCAETDYTAAGNQAGPCARCQARDLIAKATGGAR